MRVADYRNLITACEDLLSVHWHSCVSTGERVEWFKRCFRRFEELAEAVCSRAKEDDIIRAERVKDRFSSHVDQHFGLWKSARDSVSRSDKACHEVREDYAALATGLCKKLEAWSDNWGNEKKLEWFISAHDLAEQLSACYLTLSRNERDQAARLQTKELFDTHCAKHFGLYQQLLAIKSANYFDVETGAFVFRVFDALLNTAVNATDNEHFYNDQTGESVSVSDAQRVRSLLSSVLLNSIH